MLSYHALDWRTELDMGPTLKYVPMSDMGPAKATVYYGGFGPALDKFDIMPQQARLQKAAPKIKRIGTRSFRT